MDDFDGIDDIDDIDGSGGSHDDLTAGDLTSIEELSSRVPVMTVPSDDDSSSHEDLASDGDEPADLFADAPSDTPGDVETEFPPIDFEIPEFPPPVPAPPEDLELDEIEPLDEVSTDLDLYDGDLPPIDSMEMSPEDDYFVDDSPTITEEFSTQHFDQERIGVPEKLAKKAQKAIESAKSVSNNAVIGNPQVDVSFPFSIVIDGQLKEYEKEKLLDIVNKNKLGITEIDLETQFACGKVLLPRISEFAAIFIAQTFRDANAKITLGPSDEIYGSTTSPIEPLNFEKEPTRFSVSAPASMTQADRIPLLVGPDVPGGRSIEVIGAVSASGILKTYAAEAVDSHEYTDLSEILAKELKYKAMRKGGEIILQFTSTLTRLDSPGVYRMLLIGSTARFTD